MYITHLRFTRQKATRHHHTLLLLLLALLSLATFSSAVQTSASAQATLHKQRHALAVDLHTYGSKLLDGATVLLEKAAAIRQQQQQSSFSPIDLSPEFQQYDSQLLQVQQQFQAQADLEAESLASMEAQLAQLEAEDASEEAASAEAEAHQASGEGGEGAEHASEGNHEPELAVSAAPAEHGEDGSPASPDSDDAHEAAPAAPKKPPPSALDMMLKRVAAVKEAKNKPISIRPPVIAPQKVLTIGDIWDTTGEKCPEKCNGRGKCMLDANVTVPAKSGIMNVHPYKCHCDAGWVGDTCKVQLDLYLKHLLSQGNTPLPMCCPVCSNQLTAPEQFRDIPTYFNPFVQMNPSCGSGPAMSVDSRPYSRRRGQCAEPLVQASPVVALELAADLTAAHDILESDLMEEMIMLETATEASTTTSTSTQSHGFFASVENLLGRAVHGATHLTNQALQSFQHSVHANMESVEALAAGKTTTTATPQSHTMAEHTEQPLALLSTMSSEELYKENDDLTKGQQSQFKVKYDNALKKLDSAVHKIATTAGQQSSVTQDAQRFVQHMHDIQHELIEKTSLLAANAEYLHMNLKESQQQSGSHEQSLAGVEEIQRQVVGRAHSFLQTLDHVSDELEHQAESAPTQALQEGGLHESDIHQLNEQEQEAKQAAANKEDAKAQAMHDKLMAAGATLLKAASTAAGAAKLLTQKDYVPGVSIEPAAQRIKEAIEAEARILPPVEQCCLYCDALEDSRPNPFDQQAAGIGFHIPGAPLTPDGRPAPPTVDPHSVRRHAWRNARERRRLERILNRRKEQEPCCVVCPYKFQHFPFGKPNFTDTTVGIVGTPPIDPNTGAPVTSPIKPPLPSVFLETGVESGMVAGYRFNRRQRPPRPCCPACPSQFLVARNYPTHPFTEHPFDTTCR